jgi:hypothetical protein
MEMNVVNKNNGEKYKVYDIKYNKSGYPHFLIYKDGQWLCMSAKYFRPYTTEDIDKTLNSFDKLILETF